MKNMYNCLSCKDKKITETDFQYNYFIHSTPTAVTLCLTHNCNLSCPYCFVKQKPERMSLETAKKAIEWTRNNYALKHICQEDNQEMKIYFFGGEPLLEFNTIIAPILEKYGNTPHMHFGITTNGTLLTEEMLQLFAKYNVSLMLSFDGVEEIQNAQRPGKNCNSYQTLIEIIPKLLFYLPNTIMRSTITQQSIPYIYDTYLLANDLGFKNITMYPNYFEDWNANLCAELHSQVYQISNYIQHSLLNNTIPTQLVNIIKYFQYVYYNQRPSPKTLFRCGLGTSTCGIAPNGDILSCHDKSSSYSTLVLGNVVTGGINKSIHEQFLYEAVKKINSTACCEDNLNCDLHQWCASRFCIVRLEDFNYYINTAECAFSKTIAQIVSEGIYNFYLQHKSNPMIEQYFAST